MFMRLIIDMFHHVGGLFHPIFISRSMQCFFYIRVVDEEP